MHGNDNDATILLFLQRPGSRAHCCLRQPRSRARRGPWRAQPAPGKGLRVSPRLLTAPEWSAFPCKREWPWRAPAPVTRLAMGASACECRAALQNCCLK
eukprot:2257850-Pyramimonas_sp.AAC.1